MLGKTGITSSNSLLWHDLEIHNTSRIDSDSSTTPGLVLVVSQAVHHIFGMYRVIITKRRGSPDAVLMVHNSGTNAREVPSDRRGKHPQIEKIVKGLLSTSVHTLYLIVMITLFHFNFGRRSPER